MLVAFLSGLSDDYFNVIGIIYLQPKLPFQGVVTAILDKKFKMTDQVDKMNTVLAAGERVRKRRESIRSGWLKVRCISIKWVFLSVLLRSVFYFFNPSVFLAGYTSEYKLSL
jgi:hypothetical protein